MVTGGSAGWLKKDKCCVHLQEWRSRELQTSQPDLSLWEDLVNPPGYHVQVFERQEGDRGQAARVYKGHILPDQRDCFL